MGIKTKSCEEHTLLREMFCRSVVLFSPADGQGLTDDEFPVDASAVGTAITLTASPTYAPGWGCCVAFKDGAVTLGGTSSATFRIVGFNQFNEPVTEDVTITNPVAAQSLNAFRRINSIKLTAKAGIGAGGTCDIGWPLYADSKRIALPFKLKASADIAALVSNTGVTTLNPTVSTTYHTIQMPTSGFNAGIGLPWTLVLADGAHLKY